MTKHEIESWSFNDLRVFLETRYQGANNKRITIGVVIFLSVTINSLLDNFDTRSCYKRNFIESNCIIRLKMLWRWEHFCTHKIRLLSNGMWSFRRVWHDVNEHIGSFAAFESSTWTLLGRLVIIFRILFFFLALNLFLSDSFKEFFPIYFE